MKFRLYGYNNVAELNYDVTLTTGTGGSTSSRALGLTIAPDGNLMALKRVLVSDLPSGLMTSGTNQTYVLSKINSADGSVIWNKLINLYTDTQWNSSTSYVNGFDVGYLAEMAVDSTGASYVAWGVIDTSGYVKYDTNGTLVTTYDRVADASTETFGKYNSKPAVIFAK